MMTGKRSKVVVGFTVVALAILVLTALWFNSSPRWREPDTAVILVKVQTLSELVTVKYVMDKIVTHEIEALFGKDRVLLVAHGIVKAGIDLRKMTKEDIRVSEKAISLHLPRSEVTDAYLDERRTFVYDRRTGLLVPPDKNLESEARRLARSAMLSAAHANGIHKDSDDRARALMTVLLQQFGFTKVEFH